MQEKWIEDALKEAQARLDAAEPVAVRIHSILDKVSEQILDTWRFNVGDKNCAPVVHFVATHDGVSDTIYEMCRVFFAAGYCYGKQDEKENYYGNKSES